jgi:hypothetical protein
MQLGVGTGAGASVYIGEPGRYLDIKNPYKKEVHLMREISK